MVLNQWSVFLVAAAYITLLFAIAYMGDRRAAAGRSLINNPYVYALSMGVYATAWTFYGSVGMATVSGLSYLTIYLGPTLAATLWWVLLRKMVRIAKEQHVNSLADFISARYGKSAALGGWVTVMALLALTPYIAVQLKAIDLSLALLMSSGAPLPEQTMPAVWWQDSAFHMAIVLAAFAIVFGTRKIDASERHEGMVAAVAFESLVKIISFVALALFVIYGLFDGLGDLFSRAQADAALAPLLDFAADSRELADWPWLLLIAGLAIFCLPRQFQVAVLENVDEQHIRKASWLFPLYLLLFSLFTLPIAFAGLLLLEGPGVQGDSFVISLALQATQPELALVVFIGGLSAATAMVIIETSALSTMICNNLAMPLLFRIKALHLQQQDNLSLLLLSIRRGAIMLILLLGYSYLHFAGAHQSLVSIGLVSFVAVAQFAPALLGGILWKQGNRLGATAGMLAGFALWFYTMVLPLLVQEGWLDPSLLAQGPAGIAWLRPHHLFGMEGLSPLTHAIFWSLLVNLGLYLGLSLFTRQGSEEQHQAALFVDTLEVQQRKDGAALWQSRGKLADLHGLLVRVLGYDAADQVLAGYDAGKVRGDEAGEEPVLDSKLMRNVETHLAGVVGAASARMMVSAAVHEEPLRDGLTGLPNRTAFLGAVADIQSESKLNEFALAYIGLDRFRMVTDSLGYAAGQMLVRDIARRLEHTLLPGELLARSGQDAFALLLPGVHDAYGARTRILLLQREITQVYHLVGSDVSTTVSSGIALSRPKTSPERLLQDAETAMRRAREEGLGGYRLYETKMREQATTAVQLEAQLHGAIERNEMEVRYQPIIELATNRLSGFEALLRWHPHLGRDVQPTEFIPVCEETGLILQVGDWVLEEACRQLAQWREEYPERNLKVSVNLSVKQFNQPDLVQHITRLLEDVGLPAQALKLEVTESLVMDNAAAAVSQLEDLHALGIELLMDDFGTGFSSLSYLNRLPLDTLKIDQSFVALMEVDPKQARIVDTTVSLAHHLGMKVIAEGVETSQQMQSLLELGAEYGQGYLFGKPLSRAAAEKMLRRTNHNTAAQATVL